MCGLSVSWDFNDQENYRKGLEVRGIYSPFIHFFFLNPIWSNKFFLLVGEREKALRRPMMLGGGEH